MGFLSLFKKEGPVSAKADLQRMMAEIDAEFSKFAQGELSELARINQFTESVRKKLKSHYKEVFPKKCKSCGAVYRNIEQYLQATERLRKGDTIYDEAGLQEYRNCPCGSTLVLWTADRRDNSEYGQARRELFDSCMEKLKHISKEPEDVLRAKLRKIFSVLSG